jgi:hypothetical protein
MRRRRTRDLTEISSSSQVGRRIDHRRLLAKVRVSAREEFGLGTGGVAAIAVSLSVDNVTTNPTNFRFFPSRFSGTGAISNPCSILGSLLSRSSSSSWACTRGERTNVTARANPANAKVTPVTLSRCPGAILFCFQLPSVKAGDSPTISDRWRECWRAFCARELAESSRNTAIASAREGRFRSMTRGFYLRGYVEHYNKVRLTSAVGYVTPKDMVAGHQQEIQADAESEVGSGEGTAEEAASVRLDG